MKEPAMAVSWGRQKALTPLLKALNPLVKALNPLVKALNPFVKALTPLVKADSMYTILVIYEGDQEGQN